MKLPLSRRILPALFALALLAGCRAAASRPPAAPASAETARAASRPPLTLAVSPARSLYGARWDEPDNPNWALYAEVTLTNHTDAPVTVETISLYANHMFYGEAPGQPQRLPDDATVPLWDTAAWELGAAGAAPAGGEVRERWAFGAAQLEFPLTLPPGGSQTGTVYLPGGTDMTSGLPMAPYTLDVQTSLGCVGYYGMATAPSGSGWGTHTPAAGTIRDAALAAEFAGFLEETQLLSWWSPALAEMRAAPGRPLTPTDGDYHAASAALAWAAGQSRAAPAATADGVAYYPQEVFETVLSELSGRRWDCSALVRTVETEAGALGAVPLAAPTAGATYRALIESERAGTTFGEATPETAASLREATVALTWYAPSAAFPGATLTMPGARPLRVVFAPNAAWEYLPFCIIQAAEIV